jgi:hypothetical protein
MHTGDKHDYLRMDMQFTEEGVLNILKMEYLKNVISLFPEILVGKAATPAAEHLFNVRDQGKVQYPAVKHVGIGGSHIHDWRSAQSTSHPIQAMLAGDRELTCTLSTLVIASSTLV